MLRDDILADGADQVVPTVHFMPGLLWPRKKGTQEGKKQRSSVVLLQMKWKLVLTNQECSFPLARFVVVEWRVQIEKKAA
jgi:hypothetical protein